MSIVFVFYIFTSIYPILPSWLPPSISQLYSSRLIYDLTFFLLFSPRFFCSFFKNKRIVLYDTLIEQVETPELLAILGHEIGHWKLNHTQQGFIISQVRFYFIWYYRSLSVNLYTFIYLPINLSYYLSFYQLSYLSIHLSIYESINPFIYPSIYLYLLNYVHIITSMLAYLCLSLYVIFMSCKSAHLYFFICLSILK